MLRISRGFWLGALIGLAIWILAFLLLFAFVVPAFAQSDLIEATAVPVPEPPPVVILQPPANTDYVAIGAFLFAVAAVVIALLKGSSADQAITVQLQTLHANREAVAAYERRFEQMDASQRQLLGLLANVVKAIAPLTSITADDALGDVLTDITEPGPTEEDTREMPPTGI